MPPAPGRATIDRELVLAARRRSPRTRSGGTVMAWWEWIFVVLAALLFLAAMLYGVQARRRHGGIVAQRAGRRS